MIPSGMLHHTPEAIMEAGKERQIVRIDLTVHQKEQVRTVTGREGEAIELTVQELEERIAPKLAANHSETLLAD